MTTAQRLHTWRYQPQPGTATHTLFTLFNAILGFTPQIRAASTLPPRTTNHIAKRLAFYAGRILLLITRLAPTKCGEIFMRPARAPRENATPTRPPGQPKGNPGTRRTPTSPLSARQAATRLENYLEKIEALAAQAGQALPDQLRTIIAKARDVLGCNALTRRPINLAHLLRQLRGKPRPPTTPQPRSMPAYPKRE